MFCTSCGSKIDDNLRFCTVCGAPVESETPGRQKGGTLIDYVSQAKNPEPPAQQPEQAQKPQEPISSSDDQPKKDEAPKSASSVNMPQAQQPQPQQMQPQQPQRPSSIPPMSGGPMPVPQGGVQPHPINKNGAKNRPPASKKSGSPIQFIALGVSIVALILAIVAFALPAMNANSNALKIVDGGTAKVTIKAGETIGAVKIVEPKSSLIVVATPRGRSQVFSDVMYDWENGELRMIARKTFDTDETRYITWVAYEKPSK